MRYVIIGGVAMVLQGSAHLTTDIDISYDRSPENIQRLVSALKDHRPTFRGLPPELSIPFDERTFRNSMNVTLDTDLGALDLLGEPAGAPPFEEMFAAAKVVSIRGEDVFVARIDDLISMKEAAGRPKDQNHILELRAMKKLIDNP